MKSSSELTPEQLERRREVDERCRKLQERGVPAPKSGTFGLPPKSKGGDKE